jgi:hypothetical protein
MDIELIAKLVTVAGSIFALYKVIVEFVISKKSRLRKEFKFIKDFITDLKPDTHPFVVEKGYLAITGDSTLTAKEITYLLSLSSPAQALQKYSVSRKYVEFKEATETEKAKVVFRDKYTESKRKWVKRINIATYIVFATLAFAPIPFAKDIFGTNWQVGLVVISMALLSFGPLAFTSIAEYGRVLRGEELVAMQ